MHLSIHAAAPGAQTPTAAPDIRRFYWLIALAVGLAMWLPVMSALGVI